MNEKKCFKCGLVKPIDNFYKHPETVDGYLGKCKECAQKDRRNYETENPEAIFASRIKQHEKNPTCINARRVIGAALKAGVITKPERCSGCGCSNREHRIEAHHCDYTMPMDVIWLCTPCHRKMDAQRRVREGKKPYGRSA